MKPLRAFLFSCGPSGEWSSSAFRELEPLLEAAKAALVEGSASAVIHVGFWRPETAKVVELAQKWAGRLLLSESALGSLPPPVFVSKSSIGEIEGLTFRLALDGFGYQVEDPTEVIPIGILSPEPNNADCSHTAQGWVKNLITNKPEIALLLSNARIWNDATFEENESSLETRERIALAIDRFRFVTGSDVSIFNILDNLHACPGWFLKDQLQWLELTVRTRNVLLGQGMSTIEDLAKKGSNGLLKLTNMGQASIFGLSKTLFNDFINGQALIRGDYQTSEAISKKRSDGGIQYEGPHKNIEVEPVPSTKPQFLTIADGFIESAQVLTYQQRGVWAARLGFQCKPQSLQQIASQIDLTRERVRQIETQIYKKIKTHPFWAHLQECLNAHLDDRNSPLLLNGISAVDPWFQGVDELKEPLREVFNRIFAHEFSIIDLDGAPVITRLTMGQWEIAVNSAKTMLHDMVGEDISEDDARMRIESLLVDRGYELRNELWETVKPFAMWATKPDGKTKLVGYGRSAELVVVAVLQSADHPLHYEEIYRRAKLISEKEYDERRIHQASQNVAILYNRGTYGLLSHCPLSLKELAIIHAEVEDIAAGAEPTKQWHTSELLDELLERGFYFDGKLTKYIISIALRNSKTFSNMRRMVWGYKEAWQASAASRLDMRQAVMALLEEAGRPLSTLEIRELLEGDRGVNNHFQIHPQGNLIRMGSGLWGLASRDIKMNDPQALLDQLANHLQTTQEGIHSSEVAEILGGIDEYDAQALLGLIKQKGMRRDRAQYVYLSSWPDARRIWPTRAIELALDANPDGMTIEQVRLEVKHLTKRELNGLLVGSMLFHTDGAFYNSDTELWKRKISANLADDEE
jgi:hypothetical protein